MHPLFIFAKMKRDSAFHYTFSEAVTAPDLRYYNKEFDKTNDVFQTAKSELLADACQNLLDTNLAEMDDIDKEYQKAFTDLRGRKH